MSTITEISSLEPTSAIVIYTGKLDTTIEEALRLGEVGERGFRFNKEKATELTHIYLATPIDVPGEIRTINIQAKAHITDLADGEGGVIFKVDQIECVDIMVHARFGDVRNAFMYCDDYHLETTIKQREQNKKLVSDLKSNTEQARLFLASHKPKELKIPREQVQTIVKRFMDALEPRVDVIKTAQTILAGI